MRGRILSYNGSDFRGLISGQDGRRYDFVRLDWQAAGEPAIGLEVDFRPDATTARDVFLAAPGGEQPSRPAQPQPQPAQPYAQGHQPYAQPAQMSFGDAIQTCFEKYVTFNGRARRAEFWWFVLFLFLVRAAAAILDAAALHGARGAGPLSALSSLGLLLPWLAVMTRRMHDTDRSGFWVLGFYVASIVVAGGFVAALFILFSASEPSGGAALAIYLCGLGWLGLGITWIVMLCLNGTRGPNRYGPDPLYPVPDVF
jgi:uncharacterized membrane protein YhaH (DUF805 family)